MADHNDDLLDDDGLDGPAYEVDLADADEDALLADDYDDTPIHRKVIERLPDEEDFIELGVEDDIAEEMPNDGVDNGMSFDNANDSDDEVKERSRFKTERNLNQARPKLPIPETLDAVPVKTIVQPVRARGGGQQQQIRRGGRGFGHFRGRGRGGPHHFPPNFHHQQNFNNYQPPGQGGYYPPPQHQQYGPPPHQIPPPQQIPPGPPYHQQPPAYHPPQQQGPPPQQYYPPPHQQQPPQSQPPPHQVQQHQPPPPPQQQQQQQQQQLPPAAPPLIPPGQKIHVNPHFKNNLGTLWNGISSSWNQQNPQQAQPPNDPQYAQQREWESPSQDYYPPQGSSQTSYNQYPDNQYYQPPQQDYYQQNNPPPPQPYQQPPSGPPPQQASNWDGNANTSYYPPAGPPSQFNAPPDPVNPHIQGMPGPGYPPPGPMGPPPPGPPQMGPPPGPRGPPHFPGPGGPPPMRGPPPLRGRGGMHPNLNMMGSPRKIMRMQHPNQQLAPGPGVVNVRMRLNTNRPNFVQNKKFGNNFSNPNPGLKFRQVHQNQLQQPNKLFPNKLLRGDVIMKKIKPSPSNIVPIKTEDQIPVVPPEDEDEETKAYRKKIEEQKKMREDLLRQKEERRKVAAQQKLQQLEEGGSQSGGAGTSQGELATTYKTVRIMQSDGTTVLRKHMKIPVTFLPQDPISFDILMAYTYLHETLTLAQIAKLKKITPGSAVAKQPVKKEEPASKVVSVENLSASTTHRQLLDMARSVGTVEKVTLDAEAKKAKIRFTAVDTAQTFVRRNHRKMVDLSMIQVTLVPETGQTEAKPT